MQELDATQQATKLPEVLQKGQPHGSTMIAGQTTMEKLSKLPTETINGKIKAALNSLPNCALKIRAMPIISSESGFIRTKEIPSLSITHEGIEKLEEIHKKLLNWCAPCRQEIIKRELYAMTLVMARKKDEDIDFKAMIAVYSIDLCDYPEDVILSVCRDMRAERKFFPSLNEIKNACNERFEFRKAMLREIEASLSGTKQIENHSEEWTPPTEEEKQRVSEMIGALF